MAKDRFLQHGGQRDAFRYVSHLNCLRYFSIYFKTFIQATLYYNLATFYPFGTEIEQKKKCDFAKVKAIGQNKWHHQIS